MTKEELGSEAYGSLLDSIMRIMMRNGIRSTTMDFLASKLQMSKRTLYEIFTDKRGMVGEVLKQFHAHQTELHMKTTGKARNELEAILMIFINFREILSNMDLVFYVDMDAFYTNEHLVSREEQFVYLQYMIELMHKGQEKGYFRKDMDRTLAFRMMVLQMESLKRMEESFPPDIKLLDVYDAIVKCFMRGITTLKWMKTLDNLLSEHLKREP